MKHFQLLPILSVVAIGAWAQPAGVRGTAPPGQAASEHRRAELRLILKEPRVREVPDKEHVFENVAYDRHLSAQERADLRDQLRRLRLDGKPDRP